MKINTKLFFILFTIVGFNVIAQISSFGLMGYWPFDANINANDLSGNSNNGVVNGASLTTDRFGNCNQAYKFNGINNSIVVQNSNTVDMNNTNFTVALWLKTYANNLNGLPLCKNIYGSWSGYLFYTNSNNVGYCSSPQHASFYVAPAPGQDACSDNPIFIDTSWHFLTGVYNYTANQAFFYIDGVLQQDIGQRTGSESDNQNLVFGAHSNASTLFYSGVIDAIRIYNRVLNQSEIIQLYNEPDPNGGINNSVGFIKDTTVCSPSIAVLDAGAASSYTWSNGSNSQTITTNNAGTYWVKVNLNNCLTKIDSFHLHLNIPPTINILKDTTCCSNITCVLSAASSNAINYNWSTGSINSSISVTNNAIYWVDMNINQCIVRDSVTVHLINAPVINLPKDTFICSTPILLDLKDSVNTVNWSTGSNTSQTTIIEPGNYYVTVSKYGCTNSATISVKKKEGINLIIPNIITPNGDSVNDYFEFNENGLLVKQFFIYNRWGKLIYTISNDIVRWDGKQANELVDDGIYYWIAIFNNLCDQSKPDIKQKGFITLLK